MTKYKAKKTEWMGIVFDSKKEALRYQQLVLLQKAGHIKDLQRQVKYELIPKQKSERACHYIADFVYTDANTGETVVEDTKGFKTDAYRIKRKLMLWIHNVRIREL